MSVGTVKHAVYELLLRVGAKGLPIADITTHLMTRDLRGSKWADAKAAKASISAICSHEPAIIRLSPGHFAAKALVAPPSQPQPQPPHLPPLLTQLTQDTHPHPQLALHQQQQQQQQQQQLLGGQPGGAGLTGGALAGAGRQGLSVRQQRQLEQGLQRGSGGNLQPPPQVQPADDSEDDDAWEAVGGPAGVPPEEPAPQHNSSRCSACNQSYHPTLSPLVLCDTCPRAYHMACLPCSQPPQLPGGAELHPWLAMMLPGGPADYSKLPRGAWACPQCLQRCGAPDLPLPSLSAEQLPAPLLALAAPPGGSATASLPPAITTAPTLNGLAGIQTLALPSKLCCPWGLRPPTLHSWSGRQSQRGLVPPPRLSRQLRSGCPATISLMTWTL
ncbi:hypothetical protein V8C86DRAFT_1710433 [Haematococcus lacustris]